MAATEYGSGENKSVLANEWEPLLVPTGIAAIDDDEVEGIGQTGDEWLLSIVDPSWPLLLLFVLLFVGGFNENVDDVPSSAWFP